MNDVIDQQLKEARDENAKLTQLMSSMGINPRPTVAEWIQQKNKQKKTAVQEALINWDRGKQSREAAILLQQTITSHRAMKHAAWGAKKDINTKLKALKSSSLPTDRRQRPPHYRQRKKAQDMSNRTKATRKLKTPAAYLKHPRVAASSTESKLNKPTKPTATSCKKL